MKKSLLILGAGEFGAVTKEIAEMIGGYEEIAFLDDNAVHAVGKLDDFALFSGKFTDAVVAIDDAFLRMRYISQLKQAGFTIPTLIHPRAYVSPSARIGEGTIIEPLAIVHTASVIGVSCILSVGATVNHHATVCDYAHISCNSTVMCNTMVKAGTSTVSGQLYSAEVKLENTRAWMPNYSFDDGV